MESVLGRYRNLIVLVGVLFAQVLGLAVQVKRTNDSEPTRLIRVWVVGTVTPLEKGLAWAQFSTSSVWHNYFYLRGVRAENRSLKAQLERMSIDQARLSQDADQARRLQALLGFKEKFVSQTMAAQVIGGSGSESSHSVYIDKGERDHIKPDMAVITGEGVVGKVLHVYHSSSQILLINDQSSGVGALLDKTRTQGILHGTPAGETSLDKVMSDEDVSAGESVLTSGGDGVFPKGLLVGHVTKVGTGSDVFLNIQVRPAADLSRLEEVLVVTKVDERQAEPEQAGVSRGVDILAARLPGVPAKVEAPQKDGSESAAVAPKSPVAKPGDGVNASAAPKPAVAKPSVPGAIPAETTAEKSASQNADPAPTAAKPRTMPVSATPRSSFAAPSTSATSAPKSVTTPKPKDAVLPTNRVPPPPAAAQDSPQ